MATARYAVGATNANSSAVSSPRCSTGVHFKRQTDGKLPAQSLMRSFVSNATTTFPLMLRRAVESGGSHSDAPSPHLNSPVRSRSVPLCRGPAANDLPTLPLMRGTEGSAANHPLRSDRHSATATPAIAAHLNNIARRLMAQGTLQLQTTAETQCAGCDHHYAMAYTPHC